MLSYSNRSVWSDDEVEFMQLLDAQLAANQQVEDDEFVRIIAGEQTEWNEERWQNWEYNLRADMLWAKRHVYTDKETGELKIRGNISPRRKIGLKITRKTNSEPLDLFYDKTKRKGMGDAEQSVKVDEFHNPLPYTTWADPYVKVTRQYHVLRDVILPEIEDPGHKKRKPYSREDKTGG